MNVGIVTTIYSKPIRFAGQPLILACDGRCDKAWGVGERPSKQLSNDPDDVEYLGDQDLGMAPKKSNTWEGGQNKPDGGPADMNKWCARACERSGLFRPGERVVLADFQKAWCNKGVSE